jgi:hypothetical protein
MKLPTNIDGWLKFLALADATVVNSTAGPTLRTERNSANPIPMASKSRQRLAKMLVEHFGTVEAAREEIRKVKRLLD